MFIQQLYRSGANTDTRGSTGIPARGSSQRQPGDRIVSHSAACLKGQKDRLCFSTFLSPLFPLPSFSSPLFFLLFAHLFLYFVFVFSIWSDFDWICFWFVWMVRWFVVVVGCCCCCCCCFVVVVVLLLLLLYVCLVGWLAICFVISFFSPSWDDGVVNRTLNSSNVCSRWDGWVILLLFL